MLETLLKFLDVKSAGEVAWIIVGLTGQLLFTCRFLVQWVMSEKAGRSIIPMAFWYFSIAGGVVLLTYAIYRRDPVFILGQSMGVVIYLRNIILIRAEASNQKPV